MTGKIWNKIHVRGHPGAQVRNDSGYVSLHTHTSFTVIPKYDITPGHADSVFL